MSRLCS